MTCRYLYPPGKDGRLVEAWIVQGGKHAPPGVSAPNSNNDVRLNDVLWEFFQRCPPRKIVTERKAKE